jgi:hypothetical protein
VLGPFAEVDLVKGVQGAATGLAGGDAGDHEGQLNVLHGGQDRQQVVELEDEAHMAGAVLRLLVVR